jgi:hypothetical protein
MDEQCLGFLVVGADMALSVDRCRTPLIDGQIIFLEDAEEMLGKSWGVDVKLDPVWIERNEVRSPYSS